MPPGLSSGASFTIITRLCDLSLDTKGTRFTVDQLDLVSAQVYESCDSCLVLGTGVSANLV
eukprot:c34237_g1_i1 orf=574-756(-)